MFTCCPVSPKTIIKNYKYVSKSKWETSNITTKLNYEKSNVLSKKQFWNFTFYIQNQKNIIHSYRWANVYPTNAIHPQTREPVYKLFSLQTGKTETSVCTHHKPQIGTVQTQPRLSNLKPTWTLFFFLFFFPTLVIIYEVKKQKRRLNNGRQPVLIILIARLKLKLS